MECKRCGHCCILHSTIILTQEEVNSGLYKVRKKTLDGDYVLKKKTVYVKKLGKYMGVCCYFDVRTKLCTIYENRPMACRREFCDGSQYMAEWNALMGG